MKIKIYKYTCYGDSGVEIKFGTKHSKQEWEEEQKEWEEEGFSTYDDTIECIGSYSNVCHLTPLRNPQ